MIFRLELIIKLIIIMTKNFKTIKLTIIIQIHKLNIMICNKRPVVIHITLTIIIIVIIFIHKIVIKQIKNQTHNQILERHSSIHLKIINIKQASKRYHKAGNVSGKRQSTLVLSTYRLKWRKTTQFLKSGLLTKMQNVTNNCSLSQTTLTQRKKLQKIKTVYLIVTVIL